MKLSARLIILSAFFALVCALIVYFVFFPVFEEEREITLMSHDSFSISKKVVAEFEATHKVKLKFLKSGDAGKAVNQAVLSKNNPMADVFFGIDNTFMSRALDAGIFEAYKSPQLKNIPDNLKLDPENR